MLWLSIYLPQLALEVFERTVEQAIEQAIPEPIPKPIKQATKQSTKQAIKSVIDDNSYAPHARGAPSGLLQLAVCDRSISSRLLASLFARSPPRWIHK